MLDGDLEDRAERNQVPYSYISMAQILNSIKAVIKPVNVMLDAQLPDDPDEAARLIDAVQESTEQQGKPN